MLGNQTDLTLCRPFQPGAGAGHRGAQPPGRLVLMQIVLVQLDKVDLLRRAQRLDVVGLKHGAFAQPVGDVVCEHAACDPGRCHVGGMQPDQPHFNFVR